MTDDVQIPAGHPPEDRTERLGPLCPTPHSSDGLSGPAALPFPCASRKGLLGIPRHPRWSETVLQTLPANCSVPPAASSLTPSLASFTFILPHAGQGHLSIMRIEPCHSPTENPLRVFRPPPLGKASLILSGAA